MWISLQKEDKTSKHGRIEVVLVVAVHQPLLHTTHPPYVDSTDDVQYLPEHVANILCPICCDILKQPIDLACGSLVCAHCCCRWIELSSKPSCPACYTHELDNLTIGLLLCMSFWEPSSWYAVPANRRPQLLRQSESVQEPL